MKSHSSTHSNRVDKMSGLGKKKENFNSIGLSIVKKLSNAKRRRILKKIDNEKF